MINLGKHNLLGVGIDAVDYDAAVGLVIDAARQQRGLAVSALAVHGVMTGVFDRQQCFRLNQLELVVPDGQPVRWALNALYGLGLTSRVYGPELTLRVCRAAAEESLPIYLFGGTEAMLATLQQRLLARFPNLQIAGSRPSLFRKLDAAEQDQMIDGIRASGARITLVGIGCPRQEVCAYEIRQRLAMPVLAVGAAFAFHAGHLRQAPAWMQASGLEWLYRLGCEPTRLWKRYVLLNPAYLTLLALQRTRLLTLRPTRGVVPNQETRYG